MGVDRTRWPRTSSGRIAGLLLIAAGLQAGLSARAPAESGAPGDRDRGAVSKLGGPQRGWTAADGRRQPVQAPGTAPATSPSELELVQSDLREAAGDRVFFAAGSAQIGTRSRAALARQASFLKQHPGIVVVIDGHADEAGPAKSVLALSEARAEAVARLLIEEGVAGDRISTRGHGTSERVADCAAAACAAQNRRAVTRVVAAPVRTTPQSFSGRFTIHPRSGLGGGGVSPERRR